MTVVGGIGFLYYRNLQMMLGVRDMNNNLTKEQMDEPTQSPYIMICFFILIFCTNMCWILMNFLLGFTIAALINDRLRARRVRRMTDEER